MGCRLWGCTESDTTEATQQQQQQELLKHMELECKACPRRQIPFYLIPGCKPDFFPHILEL